MAGKVLTITSGKGGVGKTTATANLGVALARQGKRVVAIDADIGLRNLDVVMGLENRIVYDLVDVVEIVDLIHKQVVGMLALLGSLVEGNHRQGIGAGEPRADLLAVPEVSRGTAEIEVVADAIAHR